MASGDVLLSVQNLRVSREEEGADSRVQVDMSAAISGQNGALKVNLDALNHAVGWPSAEAPLQFGKNYTITITEQ